MGKTLVVKRVGSLNCTHRYYSDANPDWVAPSICKTHGAVMAVIKSWWIPTYYWQQCVKANKWLKVQG